MNLSEWRSKPLNNQASLRVLKRTKSSPVFALRERRSKVAAAYRREAAQHTRGEHQTKVTKGQQHAPLSLSHALALTSRPSLTRPHTQTLVSSTGSELCGQTRARQPRPIPSSQPRRQHENRTLTRVRRRDGLRGLPAERFADPRHGDDQCGAYEAYDDREEDDGLLMRLPLLFPPGSASDQSRQ